jgi:imidazole glycerol-phosphate synthase subunit HisF
MIRPRVIPALLLKGQGLVKTVKFKDPKYLGDPINIVRIFNDKEVDELIFLDITATNEKRCPPFEMLGKITSECFMPLGYGGGIRSMDDVKTLLSLRHREGDFEHDCCGKPAFVTEVADYAGSQAVVVSMDVKKGFLGKYELVTHSGKTGTGLDPVRHALEMEKARRG